jgi:hypothetical protein
VLSIRVWYVHHGGRTVYGMKCLRALQRWDRGFLFIIIIIILSGVRLSPLGTVATTGLLYQPQMIDDGDCGAIGGMKIGRRNRSIRRKPAPVPLCPPQIPHDQTRARTWTTEVGSWLEPPQGMDVCVRLFCVCV